MNRFTARLLVFLMLLFTLVSCATNIAGRKQVMLVSENKAIAASSQAYLNTLKPFKKSGKLDSDPQLVARINRITSRLIRQAEILRPETTKWDWSVKVIDDPKVANAWCMAGGKMAFYSGLMAQLHLTDDEIAQVMGHEIAHALLNHTAERMSVSIATNSALQLYQSMIGDATGTTSLASAAAQVALTLPNSRQAESEADKIGIELAAKAGYNPNAAVTLWHKMSRLGAGQLEFMSTHPSPNNREKALKQMIPKVMPYYRAAS